jgi:hypothetical protein
MFSVEHYGQRHFAVYGRPDHRQAPELVAVTVYRKGARRVADLLNNALQLTNAARTALNAHNTTHHAHTPDQA